MLGSKSHKKNFGTPEGRRKGGINSQRLFRLNPEYAASRGVKVRKGIKRPKFSTNLAEFVGIMLGDGGISNYQINITFNRETDSEYGAYIRRLIKEIFELSASHIVRKADKADRIIVSSRDLVEFLERIGLKRGSKVKNEVDVPRWILNNRIYSSFCLKGLMDTDGSFYSYRHKVSNKIYTNFAICFTNHSRPLVKSVYKILSDFNLGPVMNTERVYLHKLQNINKYIKLTKVLTQ
jgi:intein/homing endonuclease